jgi:alkylation response protein AidB-like acyl-CoA dehydrogenase
VDFVLDEQHQLLRKTVREFCEREVRPHAKAWDAEERFPKEIVPKLAELGLLGIRIPVEYGGAGLDTVAYALCIEECARVDGSLALTIASHNGLGTGHILAYGTEAQKQRYLPKAACGEWLAAWALTEPGSGSDSAQITTTAVRDGDDWVLNGSKMFISQGRVGGFCVVLARTNRDVSAHRGITAFVVDRDTPGYTAGNSIHKYGCRASDTAEVTLRDVRLPDSQRLGKEGRAFYDTMQILDTGRISIGAMAVGLGRGAFSMALRYAKERRAFGKSLGDFQAVQWMLADAQTRLDAAELLVLRAAWLCDQGLPYTRESSMAKLFASEVATKVCNDALQIHGGYGYTREFDVERHLRDVKLCEIGEGTSEVQRMIIARHLLRD